MMTPIIHPSGEGHSNNLLVLFYPYREHFIRNLQIMSTTISQLVVHFVVAVNYRPLTNTRVEYIANVLNYIFTKLMKGVRLGLEGGGVFDKEI